MRLEFDLPTAFLEAYSREIHGWASEALPGQVLNLYVYGDTPTTLAQFVSSASVERRTAQIQACALDTRTLLIRPADRHSERLIDLEADRLRQRDGRVRGQAQPIPRPAGSPQEAARPAA